MVKEPKAMLACRKSTHDRVKELADAKGQSIMTFLARKFPPARKPKV